MKLKKINPNEIITLNDFPVHNLHILKIFFHIYEKGHGAIIPPCPVISKGKVLNYFDTELRNIFKKFEKRNPRAHYFLLDGSHKTTAANLTHNKIKVAVFENEEDIKEARALVEAGALFSLTVGKTMKENYLILNKHFRKNKNFQTVEEKTERMVLKKVIPRYMIKQMKKSIK